MSKKPSKKAQKIIDTLNEYVQESGGDYNAWSVGICQDMPNIVPLLYRSHCNYWMYCQSPSPHIAQEVLDHLVKTLGINARPRSVYQDNVPCIVYVYKRADTGTLKGLKVLEE